MTVTLAETAGFCFGVDRAVSLTQKAVEAGKKTVTLGPIIHNHHVMDRFAALGVNEVDTPEAVPEGSAVIIRSHGVSRSVYETLKKKNVEIIDATCPFVARIHKLVSDAEANGRCAVIIGTHTHPEVQAIAGWCREPHIFDTAEELEAWLSADENRRDLPLSIVFQTTSTQKLYNSCKKKVKKMCTNCEIFDTICEATEKRQAEAASLAEKCDAMIVIGDAKSSNTAKLAMICRERCGNVRLVDSVAELDKSVFRDAAAIGITAGASTPAWIIKEVINMSEEVKVETAEKESFAELLEQSIKTLNNGDKVTGVVTAIGATEIQVDLGTKHAGYIPMEEFSSDPSVKAADMIKVGDEVEVSVVRVNDVEGTVMLSKKRLEAAKVWEDIDTIKDEGTPVEAVVTEENKGGIVANFKGIRVFVPASQTGIAKDGDLAALLKQTVKLKILEVNRSRKRVVGSIKAVGSEERKAAQEKIWSEIEVGKKYHGTVKSLTSFGAFVDIGGVDGMVHVSELSWSHIKNPAEVLSVGDEVDVYVISYDPEKRKISLGYKLAEDNPWTLFSSKYQVGDVINVKIVKLATFGAFAEIIPNVDGLIHISQIADHRIAKPSEVLSEGQQVDVKITDIDAERKRISLSIRALIEPEEEEAAEENTEEAPAEEAPATEAPAAEASAEEVKAD